MSLTKLAQNLISQKFNSVEYGIDATCGNGNDTLFLAGMCKKYGRIFSFDIQDKALDNARKLLKDKKLEEEVTFINSGHENIEKYFTLKADIIMFNLGFLPNSASEICTKPETSITALDSATKLIKAGGLITVLCYPGTEKGNMETEKVKMWKDEIDDKDFNISEYLSEKPDYTTPVLYVLERKL